MSGGNRSMDKVFSDYVLSYHSLPTSTALVLTADTNNAGTFANSLTLVNETDGLKYRCQKQLTCGEIQFRVAFTTSSNSAPELEEIFVRFDFKNTL